MHAWVSTRKKTEKQSKTIKTMACIDNKGQHCRDNIPTSKTEECSFQDQKTCPLIKPTQRWLVSKRPSILAQRRWKKALTYHGIPFLLLLGHKENRHNI